MEAEIDATRHLGFAASRPLWVQRSAVQYAAANPVEFRRSEARAQHFFGSSPSWQPVFAIGPLQR
jgi:hypothetical protein